jgi:hypothetical protein
MNLAQLVDKLISLMAQALHWMWRFAYEQFVVLFSHSWSTLPLWKAAILVFVMAITLFFVWGYISELFVRLWRLVDTALYAIVGVFVLSLFVWGVNLFIRNVPNNLALLNFH